MKVTSSVAFFRSLLCQKNTFLLLKRQQQTLVKASRTNLDAVRPVQHLLQNGTVLLSTSDDIVANLALEEWLYRHYDFSVSGELLLLLWANRPAVVVGRHQNVWSEVAIDYCRRHGITVVRRNSGGGTVYHDLQNLNLSFLTSKTAYNRRANLELLSTALATGFDIHTEISAREDLLVEGSGEKVSGTASKLSTTNSYHHCTLLVDVNRTALRSSLRRNPISGLQTNATKSVPSPVLNLKTLNPQLSIDGLVGKLLRHLPARANSSLNSSPLHLVDPTDESFFADISSIRKQFSTWEWTFGRTPKFTLEAEVHFEEDNSTNLVLTVEKGLLSSIRFPSSPTLEQLLSPVISNTLVGTQFEHQPLLDALDRFKRVEDEQLSVILDTVSEAIFKAYQSCCLTT